jgi:hypothetical protein
MRQRPRRASRLAAVLPRSIYPVRRRCAPTKTRVALVRSRALHDPDAVIAGILNRQQRTIARHCFTASHVGYLRRRCNITRDEPPPTPPEGEMLTKQPATAATSTIHRWLNDGIIAGARLTPGAPWRVRLSDFAFARPRRNTRRISHHVSGHAPAGRFPADPCGSVSSAGEIEATMSGADARKACTAASIAHSHTSSAKPHKQGCSMQHDPNISTNRRPPHRCNPGESAGAP